MTHSTIKTQEKSKIEVGKTNVVIIGNSFYFAMGPNLVIKEKWYLMVNFLWLIF